MKILHVIGHLDVDQGGPPRVCLGLCKALAAMGHEVTILSHTVRGWQEKDLAVTDVPGSLRIVEAQSLGSCLRTGARLLRTADVVHFHGLWIPAMTVLSHACIRSGKPYVLAPHGSLNPWALRQKYWKKRLYLALVEARALTGAGALHLLNEDEVNGARAAGIRGRYFVLPNGVSPSDWSQLPSPGQFRRCYPATFGKTLITFMARLHHGKGVDLLVDAFASLAANFPEAFVVLAGPDYGMRDRLIEMATRRSVEQRILLPGTVTGAERLALLQDTDVFVLPSHQEGHPMSVVEAAYLGKALLITPHCHCEDLCHGVAAEVVPATKDGVEAGLRRLLEDESYRIRLGRQASVVASEVYVWEKIAVRLVDSYRSLLQSPDRLRTL